MIRAASFSAGEIPCRGGADPALKPSEPAIGDPATCSLLLDPN